MIEYGEYNKLLTLLETSADQENTYSDLMAKESKVLDTINDVVNFNRTARADEPMFVNASLRQVSNDCLSTWITILQDVVKCRSPTALFDIFFGGTRIIFVGLFLVMVSLLLFFVRISC